MLVLFLLSFSTLSLLQGCHKSKHLEGCDATLDTGQRANRAVFGAAKGSIEGTARRETLYQAQSRSKYLHTLCIYMYMYLFIYLFF